MTDERDKQPNQNKKKISDREISRIKQQAIEAELRYKRRLDAVVKIQRFWRNNKDNVTERRMLSKICIK